MVAPAQQGVTELRRPQGSLPGSGCRALARTGLLVTLRVRRGAHALVPEGETVGSQGMGWRTPGGPEELLEVFLCGPVRTAVLGGDVLVRVHGVSGHSLSAATAEAPCGVGAADVDPSSGRPVERRPLCVCGRLPWLRGRQPGYLRALFRACCHGSACLF